MSVRVYDIPHASSRAVIFPATITAPFAGGFYDFSGAWTDLPVDIPLSRGVFVVRQVQFAADVTEGDWTAAIVAAPRIWFGLDSDALASIFRWPLPLNKYTEGTEFIETIRVTREPTRMKARVAGRLQQTPALIGKAAITINFNLLAYEIGDDAWRNAYLEGWKKP